jgi:hypothetical protein
MERETLSKIKDGILGDDRIWTIFILKKDNEKIQDEYSNYYEISSSSLDKKKTSIVLTLDCKEPYSVFRREIDARSEFESTKFDNINSILKDTIYCFIVRKEFNNGPNADEILLDYLE